MIPYGFDIRNWNYSHKYWFIGICLGFLMFSYVSIMFDVDKQD